MASGATRDLLAVTAHVFDRSEPLYTEARKLVKHAEARHAATAAALVEVGRARVTLQGETPLDAPALEAGAVRAVAACECGGCGEAARAVVGGGEGCGRRHRYILHSHTHTPSAHCAPSPPIHRPFTAPQPAGLAANTHLQGAAEERSSLGKVRGIVGLAAAEASCTAFPSLCHAQHTQFTHPPTRPPTPSRRRPGKTRCSS